MKRAAVFFRSAHHSEHCSFFAIRFNIGRMRWDIPASWLPGARNAKSAPHRAKENVMGPMEILLIVLAIALLFGAKKLPEIMKGMGQGIKEFKKEVKEPVSTTVQHTVVDVPSQQLDPATGQPVTVVRETTVAKVQTNPVQTPVDRR